MITRKMVARGYDYGYIIVDDGDDYNGYLGDEPVVVIGNYWFYFTEFCGSVEEYKNKYTKKEIIDRIYSALRYMRTAPEFVDEYLYYEKYLREVVK